MFQSPTLGPLKFEQVLEELIVFVREEPTHHYTLVIGTDSHAEIAPGGDRHLINFVSAIIIHRTGRGGRYFWRRMQSRKVHSLREKIHREVQLSIELAHEVLDRLRPRLQNHVHYDLEVHVDVGATGATRELVREVVGMVQGNGFLAKTKPVAYGAFIVADKHT